MMQAEITRNFVTIDSLLPQSRYACSVRAHNSLGWSEWSDYEAQNTIYATEELNDETEANEVDTTCRPSPVMHIYAKEKHPTSVCIHWWVPSDECLPIDAYAIRIAKVNKKAPLVMEWTEVDTNVIDTEYIITGLERGCGYHVAIRCHNQNGWGDYSSDLDTIVHTKGNVVL